LSEFIITNIGAENAWILVRDGKISATGKDTHLLLDHTINAAGLTVLPGFIDVHVHGAVGCDTMDANPESLLKMAKFYAQHGVTSFLATTMTAPHDKIMKALNAVREVMDKPTGGARIRGVHLEGPYINVKMIGAQNPAYVRTANFKENGELLDVGVIQRITIAPEFPDNHGMIEDAAKLGIAVSAGHTQATPEDMQYAISLGLRHTTHTYNAMVGLHHRNPGTVGAAMAFDELTCELIPDNVHVHPIAMRALYNAKRADNIILITDAIGGTGMPDGSYSLGGLAVTVTNGEARLTEGGALAGSVLTFERGTKNFQEAIHDNSTERLAKMSAANAAKAHPNLKNTGQLAAGYDADIVILDQSGTVRTTIVCGEVVYQA
jgi:N-acetylglucosamine-6-phosphate deacetylase